MSVHIGELHTEVVPAAGPRPPGVGPSGPGGVHSAAEHHREAAERAAWLAARVAAEGFDD
ncbi:hypothetical protein [Streptomyces sp. NBC_01408]|uniref:hypothetical protein n=1 Tax=Streptomyces sp. NBC_01408 TaxID=2903855 RepID=UPI002255F338|nr:hypothetical protein [Streptomyces sp. NBC_01408]MCX4695767.1 hypothetical protein [Streptomyces sp. NBC_01408]